MSGSFEKSVKGGTKIKVRGMRTVQATTLANAFVLSARPAQGQVRRAYSRGHSLRRGWSRRSLSHSPESPQRRHMDHSLQSTHHRASDDQGRAKRCHIALSGSRAQNAIGHQHVHRRYETLSENHIIMLPTGQNQSRAARMRAVKDR